MAIQGIGAPFGIGLVATIVYFVTIRKQVEHARAVPDTAVERAYATELRPK